MTFISFNNSYLLFNIENSNQRLRLSYSHRFTGLLEDQIGSKQKSTAYKVYLSLFALQNLALLRKPNTVFFQKRKLYSISDTEGIKFSRIKRLQQSASYSAKLNASRPQSILLFSDSSFFKPFTTKLCKEKKSEITTWKKKPTLLSYHYKEKEILKLYKTKYCNQRKNLKYIQSNYKSFCVANHRLRSLRAFEKPLQGLDTSGRTELSTHKDTYVPTLLQKKNKIGGVKFREQNKIQKSTESRLTRLINDNFNNIRQKLYPIKKFTPKIRIWSFAFGSSFFLLGITSILQRQEQNCWFFSFSRNVLPGFYLTCEESSWECFENITLKHISRKYLSNKSSICTSNPNTKNLVKKIDCYKDILYLGLTSLWNQQAIQNYTAVFSKCYKPTLSQDSLITNSEGDNVDEPLYGQLSKWNKKIREPEQSDYMRRVEHVTQNLKKGTKLSLVSDSFPLRESSHRFFFNKNFSLKNEWIVEPWYQISARVPPKKDTTKIVNNFIFYSFSWRQTLWPFRATKAKLFFNRNNIYKLNKYKERVSIENDSIPSKMSSSVFVNCQRSTQHVPYVHKASHITYPFIRKKVSDGAGITKILLREKGFCDERADLLARKHLKLSNCIEKGKSRYKNSIDSPNDIIKNLFYESYNFCVEPKAFSLTSKNPTFSFPKGDPIQNISFKDIFQRSSLATPLQFISLLKKEKINTPLQESAKASIQKEAFEKVIYRDRFSFLQKQSFFKLPSLSSRERFSPKITPFFCKVSLDSPQAIARGNTLISDESAPIHIKLEQKDHGVKSRSFWQGCAEAPLNYSTDIRENRLKLGEKISGYRLCKRKTVSHRYMSGYQHPETKKLRVKGVNDKSIYRRNTGIEFSIKIPPALPFYDSLLKALKYYFINPAFKAEQNSFPSLSTNNANLGSKALKDKKDFLVSRIKSLTALKKIPYKELSLNERGEVEPLFEQVNKTFYFSPYRFVFKKSLFADYNDYLSWPKDNPVAISINPFIESSIDEEEKAVKDSWLSSSLETKVKPGEREQSEARAFSYPPSHENASPTSSKGSNTDFADDRKSNEDANKKVIDSESFDEDSFFLQDQRLRPSSTSQKKQSQNKEKEGLTFFNDEQSDSQKKAASESSPFKSSMETKFFIPVESSNVSEEEDKKREITKSEWLQQIRESEQALEKRKELQKSAYPNKKALVNSSLPRSPGKLKNKLVSDRKASFFGITNLFPKRLISEDQKQITSQILQDDIYGKSISLFESLNQELDPSFALKSDQTKERSKFMPFVAGSEEQMQDQLQKGIKALQKQSVPKTSYVPLQNEALFGLSEICMSANKASKPVPPFARKRTSGLSSICTCKALSLKKTKAKIITRQHPIYTPNKRLRLRVPQPLLASQNSNNQARIDDLNLSSEHRWWQKRRISSSLLGAPSTRYLVMPEITSQDWRKIIEWQLKIYFLEEEKRLLQLQKGVKENVPSEKNTFFSQTPDTKQLFPIKKLAIYLPWASLKKSLKKPFEWPVTLLSYSSFLPSEKEGRFGVFNPPYCLEKKKKIKTPKMSVCSERSTLSDKLNTTFCKVLRQKEKNKTIGEVRRKERARLSQKDFCSHTDYALISKFRVTKSIYPLVKTNLCVPSVNSKTLFPKQGKNYLQNFIKNKKTDSCFVSPISFSPSVKFPFNTASFFVSDKSYKTSQSNSLFAIEKAKLSNTESEKEAKLLFHSGFAKNKLDQNNILKPFLFEAQTKNTYLFLHGLFIVIAIKRLFDGLYKIFGTLILSKIKNSSLSVLLLPLFFNTFGSSNSVYSFDSLKTKAKHLVGSEDTISSLSEIVWYLRNSCRGRLVPRGVVLVEKESSESTNFLKAIGGEAQVPVIVQSLRALPYTQNHPQRQLEKILTFAQKQAPCILFLDDLDSIGQSRTLLLKNNEDLSVLNSQRGVRPHTILREPEQSYSARRGSGLSKICMKANKAKLCTPTYPPSHLTALLGFSQISRYTFKSWRQRIQQSQKYWIRGFPSLSKDSITNLPQSKLRREPILFGDSHQDQKPFFGKKNSGYMFSTSKGGEEKIKWKRHTNHLDKPSSTVTKMIEPSDLETTNNNQAFLKSSYSYNRGGANGTSRSHLPVQNFASTNKANRGQTKLRFVSPRSPYLPERLSKRLLCARNRGLRSQEDLYNRVSTFSEKSSYKFQRSKPKYDGILENFSELEKTEISSFDAHPETEKGVEQRRVDLMLRLLTVMDGISGLNGVLIVTTSKNPSRLDPALLRPGRFEKLIHLKLPNKKKRISLLKRESARLGHTNSMPWEYFGRQTQDMTGSDIASAVNHSAFRAIIQSTVHTFPTLEYGINRVARSCKTESPLYKSISTEHKVHNSNESSTNEKVMINTSSSGLSTLFCDNKNQETREFVEASLPQKEVSSQMIFYRAGKGLVRTFISNSFGSRKFVSSFGGWYRKGCKRKLPTEKNTFSIGKDVTNKAKLCSRSFALLQSVDRSQKRFLIKTDFAKETIRLYAGQAALALYLDSLHSFKSKACSNTFLYTQKRLRALQSTVSSKEGFGASSLVKDMSAHFCFSPKTKEKLFKPITNRKCLSRLKNKKVEFADLSIPYNKTFQERNSFLNIDFLYYNIVLTSFYIAFQNCTENRELLDFLTDHLMRFKVLKLHEMFRILMFYS